MTLQRNTFEGLAVNATPTTGNSGGASGDAFALVSITGSQTILVTGSPALDGSRSARITADATGTTCLVGYTYTGNRIVAFQGLLVVEQKPSEPYNLIGLRHASGNNMNVQHRTDGALDFQGSGVSLTGSLSPVLVDGTKYRVDIVATQAASPTTSNGRIQAKITRVSDDTVIFTYDNSAVNLGTTLFVASRMGKTGTNAVTTVVIDNFATDDSRTTYIDPLVTEPTASMPTPTRGNMVVPFSWSGEVGTVVVSQQSGPTATINRPTSTTAEVVLPTDQAEDIVLRFRATSGATTDDKFATITPGAGSGVLWTIAYKNETGVWEPALPGGLPA